MSDCSWLRYSLLVFLCALNTIALTACAPQLGDSEAALVLEDIIAGYAHSRLKAQTPGPLRESLHYQVDGRVYDGDLYVSPEGARAGIVLVPGVVAAGKDDVRLIALAHTLARLRFAVLVPDLQGLRRQRVRRSDIGEVADAMRYLLSQPQWSPQGRAGIAGFSYGAGPVMLAALEPDLRARVQFVLALGGYYNLHGIVTYFTTGYYREEATGSWRFQEPNRYASWIFALSNADLLVHPQDRDRLAQHVQQHARADQAEPLTPLSGLAPDAQALQRLLSNRNPEHVPALIEQLSPRMRAELEGINPARYDLTAIEAQVILLHGRHDNMIPYTESLALARALPPERVRLFLVDGFVHVDVRVTRQDVPTLLEVMDMLLAQRASPL